METRRSYTNVVFQCGSFLNSRPGRSTTRFCDSRISRESGFWASVIWWLLHSLADILHQGAALIPLLLVWNRAPLENAFMVCEMNLIKAITYVSENDNINPFCLFQIPASACSLCPSCERSAGVLHAFYFTPPIHTIYGVFETALKIK